MNIRYSGRLSRLYLTVAALSVAVAAGLAYTSPATGFELSIYRSTPLFTWIGVSVAAIGATMAALTTTSEMLRRIAIGVLLLAITVVLALPVIRGYYYLATVDAYNHLGSVRDILGGTADFGVLVYPALHIWGATLAQVFNVPAPTALLLALSIFALLYIVSLSLFPYWFVPGTSSNTIAVALLIGFTALPLTTIVIPLYEPIPTVVALLFFPFLIYLATRGISASRQYRARRWTGLLIIGATAMVFLHPQHAFTLSGVLFGLAVANRWYGPVHRESATLLLTSMVTVAMILFWYSEKPASGAIVGILVGLINLLQPNMAEGAGSPGGPSAFALLEEMGRSIVGIATKLLFPKLLLIAIAAIGIFAAVQAVRNDWRSPVPTVVVGFVIGGIPILGLVLYYAISGGFAQLFRYIAVGFVGLGIVACFGIGYLMTKSVRYRRIAVTIAVLGALTMGLVIYPSPYVAQETTGFSKSMAEGDKLLFDHQSEADILSLRAPMTERRAAAYGKERSIRGVGVAPAQSVTAPAPHGSFPFGLYNQTLPSELNESRYIPVSKRDRVVSTVLYEGILYSEDDFAYLERTPYSQKTIDTGELEVYLMRPADS